MPTYEYGCSGCGHQWELEQRISENPIRKCPSCGKRKAKRLISGGNFILKGGGWEADLYHKPAPKSEAPSSKSDAPSTKGESKSSSSSDSNSAKSEAPKKASPEKASSSSTE